ncbi:hypothetical protein FACS189497_12840 [Betaproteobacteria bacterium]|nr:hypothetical protein FACS189488_12370 [Betaproteobacteria bacterium]GHU31755.1 hypothetical protein FACS189497_12840 [Betaproteobacteria bacterium]
MNYKSPAGERMRLQCVLEQAQAAKMLAAPITVHDMTKPTAYRPASHPAHSRAGMVKIALQNKQNA